MNYIKLLNYKLMRHFSNKRFGILDLSLSRPKQKLGTIVI